MDNVILSGMLRLLISAVLLAFAVALTVCLTKAVKKGNKSKTAVSAVCLALCTAFLEIMLFYGSTRKPPINEKEAGDQIQYVIDYVENDDANII